jgi:phage terminase large subunit-like protein
MTTATNMADLHDRLVAKADAWAEESLAAEDLKTAGEALRLARGYLIYAASRRRAAREAERTRADAPATEAAAAPSSSAPSSAVPTLRPAPAPAPPVLRAAQTPPDGDWRTWLFLGGRGAGKTLAGAAWLADRAKTAARLALIAPALADAREVMIEGPSGLKGAAAAFAPLGKPPVYEPSRRRLVFANGAVAGVFSAEDPESLRGPQFEAAWADELCAWPRAEETLALLRMGLRLGTDPRLTLTTTPKPTSWLRRLLAEPGLASTRGSALDNAAHLSPGFVEGLRALYGGTRLERQELDGEVLEALEGAVFRRAEIERARELGRAPRPARFARVAVAVDPPVGRTGAACGIVIAAGAGDGFAWALEDRTVQGLTPLGWADRVAEAARRAEGYGPVEIVAEANQGGELVRTVLEKAGVARPVLLRRATLGKAERAEPVALLYEQGRIAHAAGLDALEDQMLLLGADEAARGDSPDRADALVWALTVLMLERRWMGPRIRML